MDIYRKNKKTIVIKTENKEILLSFRKRFSRKKLSLELENVRDLKRV